MKIALPVINLALKWHFQVPFCNLGHEFEHFRNRITEVCYQLYLCFYSKITLKNALRWLHESWGAAPTCTVVNGCACMFALSLQYVPWQHSHASSGVFSWAQTTAKAQAYSSHATPAHVWPCQGLIASRSNSHAWE